MDIGPGFYPIIFSPTCCLTLTIRELFFKSRKIKIKSDPVSSPVIATYGRVFLGERGRERENDAVLSSL